jgi:hypothetical protein
MKLYMFRTVPLSIIRSFSLYTQQWYMLYRFADNCEQLSANQYNIYHCCVFADNCEKLSANRYDIYHCCVYSEKLLMMDRETVRNMQNFIPEINLRNWCI